mgnify:CR=1 FL=1
MPLADTVRPTTFDEMVGQQHLVGPNGILRQMANDQIHQSIIFYGPPGLGKTTTALILAEAWNKPLHKLNAVSAGTSDIKKIVEKAPQSGVILYLDEIQYFNKKQQQSLLPYVESGIITLIASTTENPYHNVYDALISRCMIVEFIRPTKDEIATKIKQVSQDPHQSLYGLSEDVISYIAGISAGDVRRALNTSEIACMQNPNHAQITVDDVQRLLPAAVMAGFDTTGDNHYGYISALQKSIRGSDPDAAVFWLTKLLEGGDIISPCRRLPAICCEDIGLAYPEAIVITMACCQAAETLGLPEAYKPLTQAVLLLATAPKSCSNEPAWMDARDDIKNGLGAIIPAHINGEHAPGYKWAHEYPNHWVDQQYLPDDIKQKQYYKPGDNPTEQQAYAYWERIKNNQKS